MADRRIWPLALAGAAVLHVALLPVVVPLSRTTVLDSPAPEPDAEPGAEVGVHALPSAAPIALIAEADLGALVPSRPAPFDFSSDATEVSHPMPNADADRAGVRAASRGGGTPGDARDTLRDDREDMRAEIWNDSDRGQVATEGSGRRAESPEAVTRSPTRGHDGTTDSRPRARTETEAAAWRDADPIFDAVARHGREGRSSPRAKTAIADEGTRAADVPTRGRLVDALDSSARSDSQNPAPFELAQRRGGTGIGAAPGGTGRGTASRKSAIATGRATESVHASRTDPYFRKVYAAIDRHVRFPKDLARRLEQGVVVVRFRLNPEGRVSGIRLTKSSGFEGFDRELLRALKKVKGFGPVPKSILGGAKSVLVTAPYKFANPLIR